MMIETVDTEEIDEMLFNYGISIISKEIRDTRKVCGCYQSERDLEELALLEHRIKALEYVKKIAEERI